MEAWLGLGANLGDRAAMLGRAVRALAVLPDTRVVAVSSVFATEPVGATDQPEFLNAVAGVETALAPVVIVRSVKRLERALGRGRRAPGREREIDIDVLLAGDAVVHEPGVDIPHPRMHERRFVLVPLCEVAPDARHPLLGRTVRDLLDACTDRSRVARIDVVLEWKKIP